jgi:hypothetical protein
MDFERFRVIADSVGAILLLIFRILRGLSPGLMNDPPHYIL